MEGEDWGGSWGGGRRGSLVEGFDGRGPGTGVGWMGMGVGMEYSGTLNSTKGKMGASKMSFIYHCIVVQMYAGFVSLQKTIEHAPQPLM